jgi:hypothetical protein
MTLLFFLMLGAAQLVFGVLVYGIAAVGASALRLERYRERLLSATIFATIGGVVGPVVGYGLIVATLYLSCTPDSRGMLCAAITERSPWLLLGSYVIGLGSGVCIGWLRGLTVANSSRPSTVSLSVP